MCPLQNNNVYVIKLNITLVPDSACLDVQIVFYDLRKKNNFKVKFFKEFIILSDMGYYLKILLKSVICGNNYLLV